MSNENLDAPQHFKINKVAVIGSGIMGSGIEAYFSSKNLEVQLFSKRSLFDSRSLEYLAKGEHDLIIECCDENFEIKKRVLSAISKVNTSGILSTCTSSLSINSLQQFVHEPQRFMGIHFMNPAKVIPVVEVIPGKLTDLSLIQNVKSFLESLGKEVFIVQDSPGFAVNSILISMLNQSVYSLDQTKLEPKNLDEIIKKTTGMKLGPLATIDLIGIDVTIRIMQNLHESNSKVFPPPAPKLLELEALGNLGRKSKKGFYTY